MKKYFIIACLILAICPEAHNQPVKQIQLGSFRLQSSALIPEPGEKISLPDYRSNVYWFPVKVPSTVLSGLVANGIYPDPYQGMNNMFIPDASDEFNKKYDLYRFSHLPNDPNPWKKPYWYRTSFKIPASDKGQTFQLIFKGINYRAAVWINGTQISDSTRMAGMFAEYSFNITKYVRTGAENAIAVKIYPLDYPGLPSTEQLEALGDFYPNGGPTGDIGKNVTMLCSAGWDWMPPVRDRNIGIWAPVYLRTTGSVTISSPKVVTMLPGLPDTSRAEIAVSFGLVNHGSTDESGKLTLTVSPENFKGKPMEFSQNYSVKKNSVSNVDFAPGQKNSLSVSNPALWWPNGYGRPNLYRIRIRVQSNSGVTDDTSFVFGIRTVSTKALEVNGTWRRDFYVNGRRLHITGGAWVPDMMLNRDSLRYDHEMRLCRNSNINLVRIWGGGVTPRDEFFDAADRYGLLVWSDFWITGDTQGEFKGSPDWPFEGNVFINNVRSTILRIRNHPSLLVWTGGNEGHARKELYDVMRNSIIQLDGTRPYIPSSSGFAKLPNGFDGAWPDNLPTGVYSGGPYTWQDPKVYYQKAIAGKDWVFKDETGLPSMPPYNILPRIIPDLVWDKTLPFPLNHTWGYHDAATGNGRWDQYYNEMVKRYGAPSGMEDFSNKMQLMNATGYQGIFEAAGHKLNDIGGVMLWKLNAAFPSVAWQVYDWYLMPNAGYYFMQNACEPVHIQLNLISNRVLALNRTYSHTAPLRAVADIYSLDSKQVFHEEKTIDLSATEVEEVIDLSQAIAKQDGISFVILRLKEGTGKIISSNCYWLSAGNDFKALNNMPVVKLDVNVTGGHASETDRSWIVEISNPAKQLAFFIRPQLMADGEEIVPSLWSAGYFSLAPSESRTIIVTCPKASLKGKEPEIRITGWNVK